MLGIPQLAVGLILLFTACLVAAVAISALFFIVPVAALSYGGFRLWRWYDLKIIRKEAVQTILTPSETVRSKLLQALEGTLIPEDARKDAATYLEEIHRTAAAELNRIMQADLGKKAPYKVKRSWFTEYEQEARAIIAITNRLLDQIHRLLERAYPPIPDGIIHPEQIYTDPIKAMKGALVELIGDSGSEAVSSLYTALVSPEEMCKACHFDGRLGIARLDLDSDVRFEHQWVIAPSGTGKTTLLQTQIVEDLARVHRGQCSIIVIDSQNQLIPKIAKLKVFAPGQQLHGKLIVLEPDPDYPPALNVLDIGLDQLSTRDRYRMQAEALENIKSCMATMADLQDDMLSYIVELSFVIPGATIQTIINILRPNGLDAYRKYLDDVDELCRSYFEVSFEPKSQSNAVTKDALIRRLMGMMRNKTFRDMFLNERGKFNMAKELETPKVILINTDLEFLRPDACQLFGRFFIAQLLQASEMRGERSLPVFCYIDECQDYIANDDNAAKLMDKARKRKIGMIFAHQRLANIESPNVRDALANVGVRFAGGNETDASYLSKIFRCDADFIANKRRGSFACFVRRQTEKATEVYVPTSALENMPQMSDIEYAQMRQEMRERYAAPMQHHRSAQLLTQPHSELAKDAPKSPKSPPITQRRPKTKNADTDDRTSSTGTWQP